MYKQEDGKDIEYDTFWRGNKNKAEPLVNSLYSQCKVDGED